MKKIISLLLCCIALLGAAPIESFADSGITPRYNNVLNANSSFAIDENGNANVAISYIGYEGITTGATITTTLEKKYLLFFWKDVDVGNGTNSWVDVPTGSEFSTTHSVNVSSGTYRVKIKFEIMGSGGETDVITKQHEAKH